MLKESGVYDALSRGYLKSAVFSISLDSRVPGNVHEAYTFQFSYSDDQQLPSLFIQDTNRGNSTAVLPLDAAKRNMQQLFRQLITMTQSLSPLPEDVNKYLAIRLFFNETTPEEYQPLNFRAASPSESARFVTRYDNDRPHDQEIGSLNTGFHACTLKITTISDLDEATGHELEKIRFWDAEYNARMDCVPNAVLARHAVPYQAPPLFQASNIDQTGCAESIESATQASQNGRCDPTQVMTPDVSQISDKMNETRLRPDEGVKAQKEAHFKSDLSSQVSDHISTTQNTPPICAKSRGIGTTNGGKFHITHEDQVSCECGDISDDGMMVQCDHCQGWSHLPCYVCCHCDFCYNGTDTTGTYRLKDRRWILSQMLHMSHKEHRRA